MLIISIYDHYNVSCMSRNGLDAANTISPLMHDAANTVSPLLLEKGTSTISPLFVETGRLSNKPTGSSDFRR